MGQYLSMQYLCMPMNVLNQVSSKATVFHKGTIYRVFHKKGRPNF